jgi:hypothetical protein
MMETLYTQATILARQMSQTVGEKRNYYITLEQLMDLIQGIQRESQTPQYPTGNNPIHTCQ